MTLLRPIILLALKNEIILEAVHIPGKLNIIADFLSRQLADAHFLAVRGMAGMPTYLPHCIRPQNLKL